MRNIIFIIFLFQFNAVYSSSTSSNCNLSFSDISESDIKEIIKKENPTLNSVNDVVLYKISKIAREKLYSDILEIVKKENPNISDSYELDKIVKEKFDAYNYNIYLLAEAAYARNIRLIKKSLSKEYIDINTKNETGNTPLHLSLYRGKDKRSDLKFIKYLLDNGADPNSENMLHYTPLAATVFREQPKTMQLLIDRKAEVDAKDESGDTAFHSAIIHGKLKVLPILLKAKADINTQNTYGDSPLHSVIFHRKGATLHSKDNTIDIIEFLIENGANLDLQNKRGETALFAAAKWKDTAAIKLLTEAGADPNIKNKKGETALFTAFQQKDKEAIKLLLEAGADPNIKNKKGETALFTAFRQNDTKAIEILLEAGADPNIKNDKGETFDH